MGDNKTHQSFESRNSHGVWVKICNDMMDSAAWQALTRSQRYLYVEFKSRYRAKYVKGRLVSDNRTDISITSPEAQKFYSDLRTFRQDIDKLIDCGFIDLISAGYNTREVNIYGFSERWKKYGQPDYETPAWVKRPNNKSNLTKKPRKPRKRDPKTGKYIKETLNHT